MQQKILFALSLFFLAQWFVGCTPSQPRFRNGSVESSGASTKKDPVRFTSREVEEEKRENDVRPEPTIVQEVVDGVRDFKAEINKAISAFDQSKLMRSLSHYMGVPYVNGGQTRSGMDCSGYVMTVYKEALGKLLPRSASEQSKLGSAVEYNMLQFGDLIFFNTTGESASHVGVYLGDNLFAHASVNLGVTISSLESSYYKKRYESARRIITLSE